MSAIFLYLWFFSISTGVVYYTVGEKGILLLLIMALITNRKIQINKNFTICLFCLVFFLMIKSMGANLSISNNYHSLWSVYTRIMELVMIGFAFIVLKKKGVLNNSIVKKRCKNIFYFCFYLTISYTTLMLVINGKGYYRYHTIDNPFYAPQYFLIYSLIISIFLISEIIHKKKYRLQNLIKLLINGLFVFLMDYTTQFLFFLIAILTILLLELTKNKTKFVLVTVIFSSAFVLLSQKLANILYYINATYLSDDINLSLRLHEIANFLNNGDLSGIALGGRLRVAEISWDTFLQYPLFGVPFSKYGESMAFIGGHHEWVDDLGRFGIIGMLIFLIFLYCLLKKILFDNNEKTYKISYAVVGVIIMYGFFNPIISMPVICICIVLGFFNLE